VIAHVAARPFFERLPGDKKAQMERRNQGFEKHDWINVARELAPRHRPVEHDSHRIESPSPVGSTGCDGLGVLPSAQRSQGSPLRRGHNGDSTLEQSDEV